MSRGAGPAEGCLLLQEGECLLNEGGVVLEDAAVPGVGEDAQLCIRQPAGELKPLDVERETWSGKYPDGDGLYLIVASTSMACRSISPSRSVRRRQLARNLVRDRFRLADEHAVADPADFERTCLVRC